MTANGHLSYQEKRTKSSEFITQEFGADSWSILLMFQQNAKHMINITRLNFVLIKFLDERKISHTFNPKQLLETKHCILLDSLSKIMMLLEGMFVISAAVEIGYSQLPDKMTYYPQDFIDEFLVNIEKHDYRRIAGLPNPETFNASHEEKVFLDSVFSDVAEGLKSAFRVYANFYQANKMAYNKFKHGLSFAAGLESSVSEMPSVLMAFSNLRRKPPIVCHEVVGHRIFSFANFNTSSLLPYGEPTMKKYWGITEDMDIWIPFMTNTHMLYAENCGSDYIPMEIRDAKTAVPLLPVRLSEEKRKRYDELCQRLSKNTYINSTRQMKLIFNFQGIIDKLVRCFNENGVATIWQDPTGSAKGKLDVSLDIQHNLSDT